MPEQLPTHQPAIPMPPVLVYLASLKEYAFGLMSVLLLWFVVVAPQLERQAVDHKENQQLMATIVQRDAEQKQTINDFTNNLSRIADSFRASAIVFERAAQTHSRAFIKVEEDNTDE